MVREVPPTAPSEPRKPYSGPPAGSSIYSSTSTFTPSFTLPPSFVSVTVVSGLHLPKSSLNNDTLPPSVPKFKNGPK